MCQAALSFELVLCFEEAESPLPRRWMHVSLLYSSFFSIQKEKNKDHNVCVFIAKGKLFVTSPTAASTNIFLLHRANREQQRTTRKRRDKTSQ